MLPFPLDHIGIVVEDLEAAIALHTKALGCNVSWREELTDRGVSLVFLDLPNTKLELLAPTNDSGPLTRFLKSRGPGLHHLCYLVRDIEGELARLTQSGFQPIDLTPRLGAKESRIAFLEPKPFGGVLVELCEPKTV